MSASIIDGKQLGAEIEEGLKSSVSKMTASSRAPHLVVVIVGKDPASFVYVRNKEKACKRIGIRSTRYDLPEDSNHDDLISLVRKLNDDPEVDGILIQSPLPSDFDEIGITEMIRPDKDVDGFHPVNLGRIVTGRTDGMLPCTPSGIMKMLEWTGESLKGKKALVIGRSRIVGMPAALLLAQRGIDATVTISHSKSEDLESLCRSSDILIAAVGKPDMVRKEWVKEGAIVIDVGINRVEVGGRIRLVGDVEEGASEYAKWITPVPGGVGPMTISMLMMNTVRAAEARMY
ncbi:MAG: bifunctional methylenetetrahydrofolate dehydrogenase/methenyltetrahydrofolate cyclohydrolase FolD [Euryarchaeota archaeon]|nr:bifunctional methylenetetrahydrofolate dehydrogenase/methenyltetrahydrofolate cyclohydrolase FolD [Euryarchaeota archaeon]